MLAGNDPYSTTIHGFLVDFHAFFYEVRERERDWPREPAATTEMDRSETKHPMTVAVHSFRFKKLFQCSATKTSMRLSTLLS